MYAAIVKNLRGVVVGYLDEEGCEDSVKWLVARFRYRDLGLGPSLVDRYRDIVSKYLGGKPFRQLVYPVSELRDFALSLAKELRVDELITEALILASTYVSPLIAIGKKAKNALENFALAKVLTNIGSMNLQDWKLHLRIADYTILDFYEGCILEAMELIKRGLEGIDLILRSRRERISKDVKRYWRISKSSGETFLMYIDMLDIAKNVLKERKFSENVAAALAIVPVVFIPPGMT